MDPASPPAARSATVLCVEDDAELSAQVASYLSEHGLAVEIEPTGDRAVQRILELAPDVVLLDVMLPGEDGVSVCRKARQAGYDGAILMLTALDDEVDEVRVDPANRLAWYRGEALDLTTLEYELLACLAGSPGKPLSRDELSRRARGIPWDGSDRSIDVIVVGLRAKLGDRGSHPAILKSVRGVGYVLVPGS